MDIKTILWTSFASLAFMNAVGVKSVCMSSAYASEKPASQPAKTVAPYLYFRFTPATTASATPSLVGPSIYPANELDVRVLARGSDDHGIGKRSVGAGTAIWSLAPTARSASLSVAARAAAVNATQAGLPAASTLAGAPPGVAYGLDVGVGYLGFGLNAGYSKVGEPAHALAQGKDISLVYIAQNWRTVLSVGQQKAAADNLLALAAIDPVKSYSLELGGAYQMTKALSLTGGLRYSIGQMLVPAFDTPDAEDRRKTAAIYLGTAIKF